MQILQTCLVLLALLALSGVLARHVPLPSPFVQIGLGALAGWPAHGLHVELEPGLFLLLFIAPLLFVDAWRIPKRELIRNRTPVVLLALGLVLFTVVGVGNLVHALAPSISLAAAFALAAVLSPTDAVALSAMTARAPMPQRMQGILQGEALLNDASGLVSFKFAVAAALTGAFSLGGAALSLLAIGLGGLAIGVALAFALDGMLKLVAGNADDGDGGDATETLLVFLLPLGAYGLAEQLGASGILSTVAAGLAMDRMSFFRKSGAVLRTQGRFLWRMVEFVFNGLIFLLLGLSVPPSIRAATSAAADTPGHLSRLLLLIGAVTLALIGLRFVWVCITLPLEGWLRRHGPQRSHESHPRREWHWPGLRAVLAVSLGGMRGVIALAGILSLPQRMPDGSPFPARDLLIEVVIGAILCSLAIGAIALPRVLRGVRDDAAGAASKHDRQAALVAAAQAALRAVQSRQRELSIACGPRQAAICNRVADELIAYYRRLIESGRARQQDAENENDGDTDGRDPPDAALAASFTAKLRFAGLQAARDELEDAQASGRIDEESVKSVSADLDLRELALRGEGRT